MGRAATRGGAERITVMPLANRRPPETVPKSALGAAIIILKCFVLSQGTTVLRIKIFPSRY